MIAIYHVVYQLERLKESAQALFNLVQQAQQQLPGKQRNLYLDIRGHRKDEGGFDADMVELRNEFLMGFLSRGRRFDSDPSLHLFPQVDKNVTPCIVSRNLKVDHIS